MTNIMAWVKNDRYTLDDALGQLRFNHPSFNSESVFDSGIGVALSDGLASDMTGETHSGYQKLFQIGKNYLLGTGNGRQIRYVVDQVVNHKGSLKPRDLGIAVVEVIKDKLTFRPGESPEFIITGCNDEKLEVHSLTGDIMDPVLQKDGFDVNGCGAQFVRRAVTRDTARGYFRDSRFNTLADLTSNLFDWGYEAARSSGVNDQFQFGFMTSEGNAMVVHPGISGSFSNIPSEYATEDGKFDGDKRKVNDRFFFELVNKLEDVYLTQRACNEITSLLVSDSPFSSERIMENFEEVTVKLNALRQELNGMIMAYVELHNQDKIEEGEN